MISAAERKELYNTYCKSNEYLPVFHQDWWLDTVCGEKNWDVYFSDIDSAKSIVLPLFVCNKFGFEMGLQPPMTPRLGPWCEKYSPGQIAKEGWLIEEHTKLINSLPNFAKVELLAQSCFKDWRPYYWKNFSQTSMYSYLLDLTLSEDEIWSNFASSARGKVRKAQNTHSLSVSTTSKVDEFYRLMDKTYERQKIKNPVKFSMLEAIDAQLNLRDQKKIFIAKDNKGNNHAGIYLLWDSQKAYCYMAGGDPKYMASGAASLCMWEAIKFSKNKVPIFDFEGSMKKEISSYFKSFGGYTEQYHHLIRYESKLLKLIQINQNLIRA